MVKPTLLFMYMVPETGHQKAAEAIMEAVSHMDPRLNCVGIDGVSQAYPVIGNVFNKMYLQMLKRAPVIWDFLYDNPDVEEATREAREILTTISSYRIRKILRHHHPSAIVCTQAAPATAIAAEKRKGLKVPLIGVVTDFAAHSYWIHPEIDLYLVGHEDIKQEMVHKGIKKERIRVTGIPIRPKFGETSNPQEARRRLRINPDKKTLLLMGGSHGLIPMDELVSAMRSIPGHFQMVLVCGKNKALHRKIVKKNPLNEDLHLFSYVKDMSMLMSAADILITKPGGLTCSEALAKQVPMVLTDPLPGQEERNVRFLTKYQVARLARSPEELVHTVGDLLRHPKKILSMRQRAKIISKPHSAWEAARLIFDLINKRGSFAEQSPLPSLRGL